jgi:polar amino acid transport system substrate-binding protein
MLVRIIPLAAWLCALWLGLIAPAWAQKPAPREGITIPVFLDPARRIERRDLPASTVIRFVTEEDFPPFNHIGPDGALAGFNIDLARAICAELGVSCTIQSRRWELLLPAVDRGEAEAVIAAHRISADLRREYELSLPTIRVPARFAARRDKDIPAVEIKALAGRTVAVVGGSAHEAYLNAFFPALTLKRFERPETAFEALRKSEVDLVFSDGVSLAFWLNGVAAAECCAFVDGPFTESRYFGEGAGIVLRRGNTDLRQAIDYALWRISRDGRYTKLYLKHFPVPLY